MKKIVASDILLLINIVGVILLFVFSAVIFNKKPSPPPVTSVSKNCESTSSDEEVKVFYTNGSSNEKDWKRIENSDFTTENPQYVVVENSYIRIAYEKHRSQMEQAGVHTWYLKNSCGKFMKITNSLYGDYTYYVDTVMSPPTDVKIVIISPRKAVIDYYYNNHTVRNRQGMPTESIGARPFIKRIEVDAGLPGAYLNFKSSDPNPAGEREFGLGIGSHIYYGTANDWVWDIFNNPKTEDMPEAPYYLGFPDKGQYQEYYYYFLAPSPETNKAMKISMYKFYNTWGGPVINQFQEKPNSKGVFLGVIPYQGQFMQEAEFLYQEQGNVIENAEGARNKSAVNFERNGKIDIFPPDTLPSGTYQVALHAAGQNASLEIHAGNKTFEINKINTGSLNNYENFFVEDSIKYSPQENDQYYVIVKEGKTRIDNFYFIPVKSDQALFPDNIKEKLDFSSKD